MKLFIVTAGDYSDYRVEAVCSTMEKAQEFCEIIGDESRIETEYELDVLPNMPAAGSRKPWAVHMDREGNCTYCARVDARNHLREFVSVALGEAQIWGTVLADDKEHAIKIMNEKRIQMLASGEL